MSNVVDLPVITTLPIPVEKILTRAIAANLDRCLVIGARDDGSLYFASSHSDGPEALWMMEKMKAALLDCGDQSGD